jgi:hypothetical protein
VPLSIEIDIVKTTRSLRPPPQRARWRQDKKNAKKFIASGNTTLCRAGAYLSRSKCGGFFLAPYLIYRDFATAMSGHRPTIHLPTPQDARSNPETVRILTVDGRLKCRTSNRNLEVSFFVAMVSTVRRGSLQPGAENRG